MIFAALDYRHYLRRTGRFDADRDAFAGLAHLGHLPDDILGQIQVGDCLVSQRLDSKLSWAMMWFSSSPIDHAAIYIGSGRIAHMTLAGYKEHSIRVLGRNTRILPLGIDALIPAERSASTPNEDSFEPRKRLSHVLPPKAQLAWIAIRIILGFHHERFRWKFVSDAVIITAPIELILYSAIGLPLIPFLSCAILLVPLFNRIKSAVFQKFNIHQEALSHPDIIYRSLMRNGCTLFTTLGPLVATDFGLLPLKVALRLHGKGTNDSPNDKL